MATRKQLLDQYVKVSEELRELKEEKEELKRQIIKQAFKMEEGNKKIENYNVTYAIRYQDRLAGIKKVAEVFGMDNLEKNDLINESEIEILKVVKL